MCLVDFACSWHVVLYLSVSFPPQRGLPCPCSLPYDKPASEGLQEHFNLLPCSNYDIFFPYVACLLFKAMYDHLTRSTFHSGILLRFAFTLCFLLISNTTLWRSHNHVSSPSLPFRQYCFVCEIIFLICPNQILCRARLCSFDIDFLNRVKDDSIIPDSANENF